MFDIGFWELLLIGVVALLVVGPERLPGLVRQLGLWVGKAKHFIGSVQSEFGDELRKADDLQRLVRKELEIKELHETIELDQTRPTVAAVPRDNAVQQTPEITDVTQPSLPQHEKQEEKISTRD